jgi:hypothetical protein
MEIVFKRTLQKPPQLDSLMTPYLADPRVRTAEARITSAYNKFENFVQTLNAPH